MGVPVKNQTWLGLGLLGLSIACSKNEPLVSATPSPSAGASAAPSEAVQSVNTPVASPAPVAAARSEAPASFAGGKKESIEGAVGLGCEAKSSEGFLELVCRKKNGTGGHPVQAVLNTDTAEVVAADEHGELRITTPFRDGESRDITLEWSDTRYVLHVAGASAKLEWGSAGLDLRRACAKIAEETRAVQQAAQKPDAANRVLPSEAAKLPRFGVCQSAGFGSYALGLSALRGSSEGDVRQLHAELEVVRVSETGSVQRAPFASFDFSPGGLQIGPLQVYDYDDDGKDELIVGYELSAIPPGSDVAHPASIWTWTDSGVSPFAQSPELAVAGVAIEHLDFDMRPDLGDYGAYIAYLRADCGPKQCPARLTGPRFFWHSLPDGGFSRSDAAAKAALKRACPKKPAGIVVENVAQTAKNLICARVFGLSSEDALAELGAQHERLCGDAGPCAYAAILEAWAKTQPPVSLVD